jgi:hypothetical protein
MQDKRQSFSISRPSPLKIIIKGAYSSRLSVSTYVGGSYSRQVPPVAGVHGPGSFTRRVVSFRFSFCLVFPVLIFKFLRYFYYFVYLLLKITLLLIF